MNLRQTYRQWTLYLETVSALSNCSDRSLNDLGIDRRDIRSVARAKVKAYRGL